MAKWNTYILSSLLALSPMLFTQNAQAAACLTSDVSLTIGASVYTPSQCADGVSQGSGPTAETSSLNSKLGVSNGLFLASSDGTSATVQGIAFTVTAPQTNFGTWHVTWNDTNGSAPANLPLTLNLEVALFGGNTGSGYLLTNVLLPASPTSASGSFDINFTNNGGQQPNLSHLLLAGYNFQGVTSVPEPMSISLLGLGLLGLGVVQRKRSGQVAK